MYEIEVHIPGESGWHSYVRRAPIYDEARAYHYAHLLSRFTSYNYVRVIKTYAVFMHGHDLNDK